MIVVKMSICSFHSENQHFLKEIIANIFEGQGISFFKMGRMKKLLEDENYRNFVVSRLNKNLDKKLTDDNLHLEDVVCVGYLHCLYFKIFASTLH